jgi:hypothetical protein
VERGEMSEIEQQPLEPTTYLARGFFVLMSLFALSCCCEAGRLVSGFQMRYYIALFWLTSVGIGVHVWMLGRRGGIKMSASDGLLMLLGIMLICGAQILIRLSEYARLVELSTKVLK